MIKRNIPNFITLCNLFSGCIAIVFALDGNLVWCAYMVGIACVFDLLDGLFARMLKVTSDIGKQLDSMADVISFGVVPGVLLYKMIICTQLFVAFNKDPMNFYNAQSALGLHINYMAMTGFLVTVFSAIRLANFNIDTRQSFSFIGLPTPASAILIASLPLSISDVLTKLVRPGGITGENITAFFTLTAGKNSIYEYLLQPYSVIALAITTSILLVAPIPLFALKFNNFSWADNKVRYIFLLLALILIILFKFLGIPLVIVLYIVLSIINNILTKNKGEAINPASNT